MSVPTTYDCPYHSSCIHFRTKPSFVDPYHLSNFWGKKPNATTKVTLTNHQTWRSCAGRCQAIYRPQRSCGKVMFLHLSVILFTGSGVSLSRGSLSRQALCQGDPLPRCMVTCGWYASYWNAFLFILLFTSYEETQTFAFAFILCKLTFSLTAVWVNVSDVVINQVYHSVIYSFKV